MIDHGDQPGQLDQTRRSQPVTHRRRPPVGPPDRQRHPPGRPALAHQHHLPTRTAPLKNDRHPLTRQRMKRMGNNNRIRNRARTR